MTIRYEGADRSGIPRVFGEGPQADVAYSRCAEAVRDYWQCPDCKHEWK